MEVEQAVLPPEPAQPFKAVVGKPLEAGTAPASREDIIAAIQSVQDPELMLNVYELGLIYDISRTAAGDVYILMTLTSPNCPIAGDMPFMVAHAVSSVVGAGVVTVELTFDPPWTIERLSEDIRLMMGI